MDAAPDLMQQGNIDRLAQILARALLGHRGAQRDPMDIRARGHDRADRPVVSAQSLRERPAGEANDGDHRFEHETRLLL